VPIHLLLKVFFNVKTKPKTGSDSIKPLFFEGYSKFQRTNIPF